MYDAKYFKTINGFTKDLNTNEDMEFAARAIQNSKKVFYNSDAKVFHSHNFLLKDYWSRYKQIGKFFNDNSWIIDEVEKYKKVSSTGMTQAINELKYLYKNNKKLMIKSIIISLVKFIAFKVGKKL